MPAVRAGIVLKTGGPSAERRTAAASRMDGRQLAAESAGCRCSGGRRRSCSPAPSERRNPSATEEGGRDVFNDADSVQGATSGGSGATFLHVQPSVKRPKPWHRFVKKSVQLHMLWRVVVAGGLLMRWEEEWTEVTCCLLAG